MLKRQLSTIILIAAAAYQARSQNTILDAGIRFQKSIGLYYENGIAVNYSSKKVMPDRLYLGFNYVSSRLGTAINSNALKQDNFLLSPAYYFRRNHLIRPFVRVNAGYFVSHIDDIFIGIIPNKSLLLSTDGGLCIETHIPLKISASLGYNFITSNGINNVPGTIYPVFYQLTLSWNLLNHKK